jgi:hypothetical protein
MMCRWVGVLGWWKSSSKDGLVFAAVLWKNIDLYSYMTEIVEALLAGNKKYGDWKNGVGSDSRLNEDAVALATLC